MADIIRTFLDSLNALLPAATFVRSTITSGAVVDHTGTGNYAVGVAGPDLLNRGTYSY